MLACTATAAAAAKAPYVGFAGPPRPDSEVCILHLKQVDWLDIDGTRVKRSTHREARLLPGTYRLEWGRMMPERMFFRTYTFADSVTLEAGREYEVHVDRHHPIGMGYIPFLWIEDVETGEVVSGEKKMPIPSRGTHEHEPLGFFLRLTVGAGSARTSFDSSPVEAKMTGELFDAGVAAGITMRRNLAVHLTWLEWDLTDPDVDSGGTSRSGSGEIRLNVIGGGVTYYFMPANVYVSGSVGFGDWKGVVDAEGAEVRMETDPGFVLDFSAGKEWWIADGWGLGLAGGLGYHTLPDSHSGQWRGTRASLGVSLTFN